MTPSIETAKRLASFLDTSVGYLLGETDDADLFQDPAMLKRFKEIYQLDDDDRSALLKNIDAVLRDAKTRQAYVG